MPRTSRVWKVPRDIIKFFGRIALSACHAGGGNQESCSTFRPQHKMAVRRIGHVVQINRLDLDQADPPHSASAASRWRRAPAESMRKAERSACSRTCFNAQRFASFMLLETCRQRRKTTVFDSAEIRYPATDPRRGRRVFRQQMRMIGNFVVYES